MKIVLVTVKYEILIKVLNIIPSIWKIEIKWDRFGKQSYLKNKLKSYND